MHECVGKLLRMEVEYKTPLVRPNWREKYPDDEDVECCCKLLASTGPRLDVKREQDSQLSKRHRSREGAPAGGRGGAEDDSVVGGPDGRAREPRRAGGA